MTHEAVTSPAPVTSRLLRHPRGRTRRRVTRLIARPVLVRTEAATAVESRAAVGRPPLAATALSVLAALLLGFVAYVLLVGPIVHARAQSLAYAQLREDLATGVAPLGQVRDNALLAPGTPIALLELPGSGVREVVREGTTAGVLTGGPGHRRDTVLPGQAGTSVLFGRSDAYGGPFGDIAELPVGRVISVTTGQGRHDYKVTAVRQAGDPVAAPLPPLAGRLTLVTATGAPFLPSGTVRVEAELVSPVQPSAKRVVNAAALTQAERPLEGDPSTLFGVVLWSQALLLAACGLVCARLRWGLRQAWLVGVPVVAALFAALAHAVAQLLPNLL